MGLIYAFVFDEDARAGTTTTTTTTKQTEKGTHVSKKGPFQDVAAVDHDMTLCGCRWAH